MKVNHNIFKKSLPAGRQGFTLIELLVSTAIFSVVMVMALGALLSLSIADRKSETLKSAVDNLTFALDSISRAGRTGSNYGCGAGTNVNCPAPAGATQFSFDPAGGGSRVIYQLEQSDTALCGQPTGSVGCIKRSTDNGTSWVAVTSPDVLITNLTFYTAGSPIGSLDNIQPRVIITVSGTVQVATNQTTVFHMQTTVAQRIYDQ